MSAHPRRRKEFESFLFESAPERPVPRGGRLRTSPEEALLIGLPERGGHSSVTTTAFHEQIASSEGSHLLDIGDSGTVLAAFAMAAGVLCAGLAIARRGPPEPEADEDVAEAPLQQRPVGEQGATASVAQPAARASAEPGAAQSTRERARAVDLQARAGVASLYSQAAPLLMQASHIQQVFQQRADTVRTRAQQVLQEELAAGMTDLTASVGDVAGAQLATEDLPPVSLIVAGLTAPCQLRMLHSENTLRMFISASLLITESVTLCLDWKYACDTLYFGDPVGFLHPWLLADCAVLVFTVAVRGAAHIQCRDTLIDIDEAFEAEIGETPEDASEAVRQGLERQLLSGAKALLRHDALTASPAFRTLEFLNITDFFFQVAGLAASFETPDAGCPARLLRTVCRVRGMAFLVGLLPALLTLGISLLRVSAANSAIGLSVLEAAHALDAQLLPQGPPVFVVLVRAFLVRDSNDTAGMELVVLRHEQRRQEYQRDLVRTELHIAEERAAVAEARAEAQQAEVLRASSDGALLGIYGRQVTQALAYTSPGQRWGVSTPVAAASAPDTAAAAQAHVLPSGPPPSPHPSSAEVMGGTGEASSSGGAGAQGQSGAQGDAQGWEF